MTAYLKPLVDFNFWHPHWIFIFSLATSHFFSYPNMIITIITMNILYSYWYWHYYMTTYLLLLVDNNFWHLHWIFIFRVQLISQHHNRKN